MKLSQHQIARTTGQSFAQPSPIARPARDNRRRIVSTESESDDLFNKVVRQPSTSKKSIDLSQRSKRPNKDTFDYTKSPPSTSQGAHSQLTQLISSRRPLQQSIDRGKSLPSFTKEAQILLTDIGRSLDDLFDYTKTLPCTSKESQRLLECSSMGARRRFRETRPVSEDSSDSTSLPRTPISYGGPKIRDSPEGSAHMRRIHPPERSSSEDADLSIDSFSALGLSQLCADSDIELSPTTDTSRVAFAIPSKPLPTKPASDEIKNADRNPEKNKTKLEDTRLTKRDRSQSEIVTRPHKLMPSISVSLPLPSNFNVDILKKLQCQKTDTHTPKNATISISDRRSSQDRASKDRKAEAQVPSKRSRNLSEGQIPKKKQSLSVSLPLPPNIDLRSLAITRRFSLETTPTIATETDPSSAAGESLSEAATECVPVVSLELPETASHLLEASISQPETTSSPSIVDHATPSFAFRQSVEAPRLETNTANAAADDIGEGYICPAPGLSRDDIVESPILRGTAYTPVEPVTYVCEPDLSRFPQSTLPGISRQNTVSSRFKPYLRYTAPRPSRYPRQSWRASAGQYNSSTGSSRYVGTGYGSGPVRYTRPLRPVGPTRGGSRPPFVQNRHYFRESNPPTYYTPRPPTFSPGPFTDQFEQRNNVPRPSIAESSQQRYPFGYSSNEPWPRSHLSRGPPPQNVRHPRQHGYTSRYSPYSYTNKARRK